jgi:hypothetical protein
MYNSEKKPVLTRQAFFIMYEYYLNRINLGAQMNGSEVKLSERHVYVFPL